MKGIESGTKIKICKRSFKMAKEQENEDGQEEV